MVAISGELMAITRLLPVIAVLDPGYRAVPLIELTIHALIIVVLVSSFAGFYIGVRISRPRYFD